MSMNCITCKRTAKVVDSRPAGKGANYIVKRRYTCLNSKCRQKPWSTIEVLAMEYKGGSVSLKAANEGEHAQEIIEGVCVLIEGALSMARRSVK